MATPAAANGGGRRTVNMLEAKTHLSRLVEAIETGSPPWRGRSDPGVWEWPAVSSRFRTRSMAPIC